MNPPVQFLVVCGADDKEHAVQVRGLISPLFQCDIFSQGKPAEFRADFKAYHRYQRAAFQKAHRLPGSYGSAADHQTFPVSDAKIYRIIFHKQFIKLMIIINPECKNPECKNRAQRFFA